MDDATRQWLEPMVRELLSRPDPTAVLTSVDTSALPPQAWQLLGSLGQGQTPPSAEGLDWLGVGALLREALGWNDYPAVPEN